MLEKPPKRLSQDGKQSQWKVEPVRGPNRLNQLNGLSGLNRPRGDTKMRINRFEDLECWKEARTLPQKIYSFTKQTGFSKDYRLAGQITGAAISIMNNICEGFDSKFNNEFIRFLTYSRRSCSEVQNCLYVALDQEYIGKDEFQAAYTHGGRVRKIIDGLIRYLKSCQEIDPSPKNSNRQTG